MARIFRVLRAEAGRWRVAVAQSKVLDSWVFMTIVSDLSFYLAIAFPCALLPIWVAVSHGLRPLRHMSRGIDARSPDNLSPTELDPRYGELKPLARSLDGPLAQLPGKVAREHAFVQEAAHELRTPLAVMSAQAQVLTDPDARSMAASFGVH